jgi:hypothetical protein
MYLSKKICALSITIFIITGCSNNKIEEAKNKCKAGSVVMCMEAADYLVVHGEDKLQAEEYFIEACKLGESKACNRVAGNLENPLFRDYDVPQDYFTAFSYYKKSCDMGNMNGCNNLGLMYEYGHGVRQDNEKAIELYKKACDSDNAKGCRSLAIATCGKDPIKAKEILGLACDKKDETSCQYYSSWEVNTLSAKSFGVTKEVCGIDEYRDVNYKDYSSEDKAKFIYHNRHGFDD